MVISSMFLYLFENLLNIKFLFFKERMNGESPASICFILQLFFFLESSASSMTWKVILLRRFPNVPIQVKFSTCCDDSTPAPSAAPSQSACLKLTLSRPTQQMPYLCLPSSAMAAVSCHSSGGNLSTAFASFIPFMP